VADPSISFEFESYAALSRICPTSPETHQEEEFLVTALKEGVDAAYEALIARYQQPVFNLVYRLTWVYRIAFNEAYNHRRWFSRHKKQEIGFEMEEEGSPNFEEILPDPARTAFDIVCDHETHALIEEALADLNPSFRAAVVLRDIEDLSYEEIAEILQVSLGTVKSRILRGREALRKALAGRLKPETITHFTGHPAAVKP
jgi:RNA polymerase sigma-70 factor (ECF subfamily)